MKDHNYYDTFIEVADDCAAATGQVPQPYRGKDTIAMAHYALLKEPYATTQQQVLWRTEANRSGQDPADEAAMAAFFAPGRACLRASPLPKQYGWGIHFDKEGRAALISRDDPRYEELQTDASLKHFKAMSSKKAK